MFTAILVASALLGPPAQDPGSPGDGLGLAERPVVSSPVTPAGSGGGRHPWNAQGSPRGVGIAAALAATGLLAAASSRRGLGRDHEPFYVVVHGNGGSAEDFDPLLDLMDVDDDRVVAFDYRLAAPGASSTSVSRTVDTDEAAAALDRLLRNVAARHENVYSIHHSKGAAAGVVAISALDDGTKPPIDGYRGAALLEAPIAALPVGPLQRIGGLFPFVADNGGFEPIRCDDEGCRDIREDLGTRAGVEVIAIRNPDAEITNFTDEPRGLRVYDLIDDGGPSAWAYAWHPLAFIKRVFQAHSSVLRHRSVADCIVAEAHDPGSCNWKATRRRRPMWGRGNGRNHVL